jgi:hypothetical protein
VYFGDCALRRLGAAISGALAALIFTAAEVAAVEDIEIGREFRVSRNFRAFTISKSATIFLDDEKIFVGDTEARNRAYTDELRKIAREQLGKVVSLSDVNSSEYRLLMRMHYATNYAIRSIDNKPSRGEVVFAICHLPVRLIQSDCQNLAFYFFETHERRFIFEKILGMWLDRIIAR